MVLTDNRALIRDTRPPLLKRVIGGRSLLKGRSFLFASLYQKVAEDELSFEKFIYIFIQKKLKIVMINRL